MVFVRPLLGLLLGIITYLIVTKAHLSPAGTIAALIIAGFPLLGLQIKLPSKETALLGLGILIVLGLIFGFIAYYLVDMRETTDNSLSLLIAIQCIVSALILFVFYCVVVEEGRFYFPYPTLFSESWQMILKVILGKFLVSLTWGLFILAAMLFQLLNISLISEAVLSKPFTYIMPPLLFGIAMAILSYYEDILTRLRNILLAFCRFLYPIFVVIILSFLLVIPFAHKIFANFWPVIIGLSVINILLFNGIFQAGYTKSPYVHWFSILIYATLIILTIYTAYILKFPFMEMRNYGLKPLNFFLFVLLLFLFIYHLSYSLAIFFSTKPWLSMIKNANTIIALIIAVTYLVLALPFINIGKISSNLQLSRLLHKQAIINPNSPLESSGYLVGANLENANLEGQDLRNINFSNANLRGANLVKANLKYANFNKANLTEANLNSADLQFANFHEANLTLAKLSNTNSNLARFNKANLSKANFAGASLENSDWNQAILQQTNFTNANLSNSYGLTQDALNNACGGNVTLPEKLTIQPCTD